MGISPEALLRTLTLDQKLAQLCADGDPSAFVKDGKFDRERAREKYPNGLFGLMAPIDLTPCEVGAWANEMRACFREITPVPPVLICESLHGILGQGATVFPQSIGMGATFDPALMRRVGEAIGREARAMGIRMSFAPDLDLGRDPRWGRMEETFGEASLLAAEMGEAYVKGLLSQDDQYAATIKHFAAHGSPESGINLAPVTVTEQELRDKYLPPFRRALDAGAKCVMPAYSSLNGVPCHANRFLLERILRQEWGFDGPIVSDFGGIEMLYSFQHSAQDRDAAALQSLAAGVDVEGPGVWGYGDNLKAMLEDGRLKLETIDRAVLRILRLKQELGLFDLPDCCEEEIRRVVHSPEHVALAREAARKSMVLLKNDGMLPLREGQTVAVVGPNAFTAQLGDYALPRPNAPTPVQAIRRRAEAGGGCVLAAHGCEVYGSDESGFDEAVKAAEAADVVVCITGGKSMKGYGVGWGSEEESYLTCGEGRDMHDLTPGGPQLDLARRLMATGKPVAVVMVDGRPETLFDVGEGCGALIAAWYPGEEGASALAALLYGDANFSARLPVTFPRHAGQIPLCHDRVPSAGGFYGKPGRPDAPGRDYVFLDPEPAFAFGDGIGYSKVEYVSLRADAWEGGLRVAAVLENVGAVPADEAALLFLEDETASLPQPKNRLVAMKRVHLAPGERRQIAIDLSREQLMFTNAELERVLEPGWFRVKMGGLSARVFVE